MSEQNMARFAGPETQAISCHLAEDLMGGGGNTAFIKLGDQLYTLRITRAGKLILTK